MSFARSGGGTRARELCKYVMLPVRKMVGDLVGLGTGRCYGRIRCPCDCPAPSAYSCLSPGV